jgi:hypothetical protein
VAPLVISILKYLYVTDRTGWRIGDALTLFGRCFIRISTGTPTMLTEGSRLFIQSLHANMGLVFRLVHGRFLPDLSKFISFIYYSAMLRRIVWLLIVVK